MTTSSAPSSPSSTWCSPHTSPSSPCSRRTSGVHSFIGISSAYPLRIDSEKTLNYSSYIGFVAEEIITTMMEQRPTQPCRQGVRATKSCITTIVKMYHVGYTVGLQLILSHRNCLEDLDRGQRPPPHCRPRPLLPGPQKRPVQREKECWHRLSAALDRYNGSGNFVQVSLMVFINFVRI